MELKGSKINFMGDSITEGCFATRRFTDLIAERYGATCRNDGIHDTRIARQQIPSEYPEWDQDFCSRVEKLDPDADAVVIFGGTNDFGRGDAPLGEMSDRTQDTFYGALHVLYRSLIEKFPTAKIAILTPLHRLNEDDPCGDIKPEPVGTLKQYVAAIREVAEFYALPVLDLYATSGLQPRVPIIQQTYMPDGLHPNDAGHEILAEKIAQFLQTL